MSLLLPLGLLGLLSIILLVLIYVIKPNYQQKYITSTYIWIQSLKYKKRKLPLNRFRNILLFLLQLIILVCCAVLLARPVVPSQMANKGSEKVVIIDASASMMAESFDETRFERAVAEVRNYAREISGKGGVLSVIIASEKPYFLVQRSHVSETEELEEVYDLLDELINPESFSGFYGSANLDEASSLAEVVLDENPTSEVILYTATNYLDKGNFTVINVAKEDEWNAAILNCSATLTENFYTFVVEVGCFDNIQSRRISVYCEVKNVNGTEGSVTMSKTEFFDVTEQRKTLYFTPDDQYNDAGQPEWVYSYESVYVHLEEEDSLSIDNSYFLYGGIKPKLKIQYISSLPNRFFTGMLINMRTLYRNKWDIELDLIEITTDTVYTTGGQDLYIFEHTMPETLPTDGVVLIVNPDKIPQNLNMRIDSVVDVDATSTLTAGIQHAITKGLTPEDITISKYVKFAEYDGFDELMYYGTDPVMLVKNQPEAKVAVLAFSLNQSNFGILFDFPLWMNNMFNYFLPTTTPGYTFEVGDTIKINSRNSSLSVEGPDKKTFTEFPAELTLTKPGTYTLTQKSALTEEYIIETIYASISNFESDFTKSVDALPALNVLGKAVLEDKDLLIYIAAGLLAILFLEWFLQSREYF